MKGGTYSPLLARHRFRPPEAVFWLAALAVFFFFPNYLSLATSALIMALFALSLDIAMGFGGIVTLGHAIFFGLGAYSAGLLALAGLHEPVSAAILAGAASSLLALILGPAILRLAGLPLLMVTLALGVIAYEAANKATWLTGGDNGLEGIELMPLFGLFRWTVYGQTAYLYTLGWLALLFWAAKRITASPFGVALQGIRENRQRMTLMGAPVLAHLVRAYAVSAFLAGVAGALSAQTTEFVSLQVFSLDNSADVMVMLVLGGVGRLYGGLIGAPVYIVVKDFAAEWNPYHWMFVIGGLLIFVVRFAKGGLLGMAETVWRRVAPALSKPSPLEGESAGATAPVGGGYDRPDLACVLPPTLPSPSREEGSTGNTATAPALEIIGLQKRFGALVVTDAVDLRLKRGARHALIGPNGAGKTTLVGLLSGVLKPDAGRILLMGRDVAAERPALRVKQGLVRTFQINNLFRGLTVLENIFLAVSEQHHASGVMIGAAGHRRDLLDRTERVIDELGLGPDRHRKVAEIAYGRQRLVELAIALSLEPKILLLDEPAAGVPSSEVGRLLDAIERLPADIAILMIEHDMQVVKRFATEVTVLVAGRVLTTGSPQAVMNSDEVRTVYLGQSGHARFAAR